MRTINKKEDYCTASPDGTWRDACKSHDMDYKRIKIMRKEADEQMREDILTVKEKWLGFIKPRWVAPIYYRGVRILGRLFV